ncbi:BTAD domain-containing putative transcriptional regulator [Streptomyces sp. NPDC013157]|uniref:AfsR/SARP family transcriptional regulator n=1 Tax=Streptomyces sp. NPDC013157 TaxID=3364861 RepID=UPI00369F9087
MFTGSVHPGRASRLRFRVLGPLTVEADGRPLPLGPHKQRLVLAVLLCRAGSAVAADLLAEALWDRRPPRTARKNIQVYVSALRKLLNAADRDAPGGAERIVHDRGGYVLRADPAELDSLRFDELVRAGRRAALASASADAALMLREALDLWRGPLLSDLAATGVIGDEAERMTLRYLTAWEDWAEAQLAAGDAGPVGETVDALVAEHPFRERLRAAQLTALYRTGRQTEAFAAYEEFRQLMARDLGLRPSGALAARYQSLLVGEDHAGPAPTGAGRAGRRGPEGHHLLPRETANFTGRAGLLDDLSGLLGRPDGPGRLVVLTGPAGIGKSALAVHLAHGLGERFPEGRFLVRLRANDGTPRPAADVIAELARAAGLPDTGREPESWTHWRRWVADRRPLLVLDDAPDEACVRALLPGTDRSSVLVTARTRLAGLEEADHRVDVPPLTLREGVELLVRFAGPERLAADRTAERIATATGLLPLALRVAGTKLAVLRHLPSERYAARLADPRTALDELSVGDTAVRPRLADWWDGLPGPVRDMVRQLASLPSPVFTPADARSVLGVDGARLYRTLEHMVEAGAIGVPDDEVLAHGGPGERSAQSNHGDQGERYEPYELPRLLRLFVREQAPGPSLSNSRSSRGYLPADPR